MKRFYSVLIVLVLVVVGVGFYRGWFLLSSPHVDQGNHKVNLNLTVDPDKMRDDAEAIKKKTAELTGKAIEEAQETAAP